MKFSIKVPKWPKNSDKSGLTLAGTGHYWSSRTFLLLVASHHLSSFSGPLSSHCFSRRPSSSSRCQNWKFEIQVQALWGRNRPKSKRSSCFSLFFSETMNKKGVEAEMSLGGGGAHSDRIIRRWCAPPPENLLFLPPTLHFFDSRLWKNFSKFFSLW